MANHFDLEEQEQLEQLKHFWKQYGNLITWLLTLVLAAFAGWNVYQYWQRSQAAQSAAMYDELDRIAGTGDSARLQRALQDMRDKFGSTTYAQHAGLLAAKTFADAGQAEEAQTALRAVIDQSPDAGLRVIAQLRLAAILLDSGALDQAWQELQGSFPEAFAPLASDRRGDVLLAQGKKVEAAKAYLQAYQGLDAQSAYRRLVDMKLAVLGVVTDEAKPAPGVATQ